MPAHRMQFATPGATTRRVSFATKVVVLGGDKNVALKCEGKIASVPREGKRKVSFAAEDEIIGDSKDSTSGKSVRRVCFAEDVEVIESSRSDVQSSADEETMGFDADALFSSDDPNATPGNVSDTFFYDTGIGEDVSTAVETSPQLLNGTPEAAAITTDARTSTRSPSIHFPLPSRNSSLHWQRQHQHHRPFMPPQGSTRTSTPRSPPPPYADDDDELGADGMDDAEIMANRNPVPAYHDDRPPPPYTFERHGGRTFARPGGLTFAVEFEAYRVREDVLVLEDVFGGMGRWVAGVRDGFMDVFGGLRYGSPGC